MNRSSLIASGFCGLILAAAIVCLLRSRNLAHAQHANLLATVPRSFPGWTVEEQKVASSPEMQRAVDDMLNYDEAIFRTFHRGEAEFSIYAAYWRPGKYPARLVAQHVPESCWTGAGWSIVAAEYNQTFTLPDKTHGLPVQEVRFRAQGRDCFVRYWQVIDGRLSGFATGPTSHSVFIGDTFWQDIKLAGAEHMFIRLSTNRPWTEWENEPLVAAILAALQPVLVDRSRQ